MSYLLGISFGLSVLVIGLAYLMDRSAITARINGANGLPLLVAVILSFVGSLVLSVVVWIFDDLLLAGKVLLFSLAYHAVTGGLAIWRLQSLATRVASQKH